MHDGRNQAKILLYHYGMATCLARKYGKQCHKVVQPQILQRSHPQIAHIIFQPHCHISGGAQQSRIIV